MLSRIIIAYDGSDLAREAYAFAVMLAAAARVPILAIRAIEPEPLTPTAGAGIAVDPYMGVSATVPSEEEMAAEREAAERDLDELGDYAVKHNVRFEGQVREGVLGRVLSEVAAPNDLIAVGQRGRFKRSGFGSATRDLVENGPCPLMVVSGELRPVNRVLAAFDGSGPSKHAVEWACELARQTGWPLSILAVSGDDLSLDDALARAQEAAPDAQVVHFGPEGRSEAEQIEETAGHGHYAVLVMGGYADSWLHQFFFGGATGHVLRHVKAPVILMR